MAKILLVDDDTLLLRMYLKKLENDGYDVEYAVDGDAGLDKAKKFKPDLILLDIMMPKVNGYEVLKSLKSDDTTKNIPELGLGKIRVFPIAI